MFFLTWKCLEACNNSVAIAMNHSYEPLCGILLGMGTCYLFLRSKRVFLSFSQLWNSNQVWIWPRVSQRLFVWSWSMMQRRNDCRSASILGAFAVPCGPVVVKFGNCKSHVQYHSIGKIPSIIIHDHEYIHELPWRNDLPWILSSSLQGTSEFNHSTDLGTVHPMGCRRPLGKLIKFQAQRALRQQAGQERGKSSCGRWWTLNWHQQVAESGKRQCRNGTFSLTRSPCSRWGRRTIPTRYRKVWLQDVTDGI